MSVSQEQKSKIITSLHIASKAAGRQAELCPTTAGGPAAGATPTCQSTMAILHWYDAPHRIHKHPERGRGLFNGGFIRRPQVMGSPLVAAETELKVLDRNSENSN